MKNKKVTVRQSGHTDQKLVEMDYHRRGAEMMHHALKTGKEFDLETARFNRRTRRAHKAAQKKTGTKSHKM